MDWPNGARRSSSAATDVTSTENTRECLLHQRPMLRCPMVETGVNVAWKVRCDEAGEVDSDHSRIVPDTIRNDQGERRSAED
ncbi:hypothetical protein K7472_31550 [Streptomyces sp. PTM05]|uniref:Uncharacterized protein n=1 Tax=Streptantibioticus parmotrematis TaxID=2873249 RepID=A0ABS7R1J4_9ACTN|nr:hypothetical protein [Streptantibioticus parmotrematis]MBY8889344.1 hypothetical protein [Streptantibioticus parmotrematis]